MRIAPQAAAWIVFSSVLVAACVPCKADPTVTLESLLAEMVDRNAMARYPQPRYACKQASSYDRSQTDPANPKTWFANKDYEQFIRVEENDGRREWVIMEHQGPGCVVRFWAPLNPSKNNQTIRLYFDGNQTPAIAVKFNDLLAGRSFVKPPLALVASDEAPDKNVGGDLYLPIPFAKSCKITLDELPFYYAINYRAYEAGARVETFDMARFNAADTALKQTTDVLRESASVAGGQKLGKEGRIEPGAELALDLSAGPATVRTLQVQIDLRDAPQVLRSAVVEARFDAESTVWCPLGEFFGCGARLNPVTDWVRSVEQGGRTDGPLGHAISPVGPCRHQERGQNTDRRQTLGIDYRLEMGRPFDALPCELAAPVSHRNEESRWHDGLELH